MTISRGAFLKLCGLALGGIHQESRRLAGPLWLWSSPREVLRPAGGFVLADATAALFRQCLNTPFTVRPADGTGARTLTLVKVTERPVSRNIEQFSLTFHAAAGETFPHAEHAVHHPALGDFDLFVGPVNAPDDRRTVYQACFSRHVHARPAGRFGVRAHASSRT